MKTENIAGSKVIELKATHNAVARIFTLAIIENLHLCYTGNASQTQALAKYTLFFLDNLWEQWHLITKNLDLGYVLSAESYRS